VALMSLGAVRGSRVRVRAVGPDAATALKALVQRLQPMAEAAPPADTWYWMWQAEQIQLQDEGYHQARGHFCRMWVEVAQFDRAWWDEEPDDNFLEKSEVSDYFDDYCDNVDYSTAGVPDVTMLPRWVVGTDGVPVDQFDRVFEALQSAYVAELGGRDNARWPFAVENDRRPDDWLR
jgi:hypothetical protein